MLAKMWKKNLLASLTLLSGVLATDILKTNGFSSCDTGTSSITVNNVDISFDRSTNEINFDVSGTSSKTQAVLASLIVTAYGKQVYNNTFDPCAADTKVDQLCPVPAGAFSAVGNQTVPSSYASMIPSIAYSIPDLEGDAQMILKSKNGQELACIQSGFDNGKSVEVPAVSYVAAAIAAAALALSAAGAIATGAHPGSSTSSPGFTEVMFWFQGMAMNGMHSVNYPTIYRSFSKNFAFSTGLIPWAGMQRSIDSFRQHTGGNLTDDSYNYLQNATLVYSDGTSNSVARRALEFFVRDIVTSVNGTGSSGSHSNSKESHLVSGIQGYVEQLTIPQANTFMTVLLIFGVVVGTIVVGILLFKVILEAWALFGTFPKSLTTFRKEYWRIMAQTITSLVLLLYGTWTLYCVFQFTHGDSWAAKLLAGVTLGTFTALLAFYTFRIWLIANKFKKLEGDSAALYENKETWKQYRIFYESYKKGYWWLFMPAIVYMFAKGCVLAAADGNGLVQTAGQLIIESLMLILFLWSRPYNRKSGNWINIIIQVVRVLSVVSILVFVEELGIAQTTKTITGVVLIAVQASLTVVLAILIAVNSIISCCRENPHRKRRKAAEKMSRDFNSNTSGFNDINSNTSGFDDINREAFLMEPQPYKSSLPPPLKMQNRLSNSMLGQQPGYEPVRHSPRQPRFPLDREDSQEGLIGAAAKFGFTRKEKGQYQVVGRGESDGGSPPPVGRQSTLLSLR
jgi:hypothetical protein